MNFKLFLRWCQKMRISNIYSDQREITCVVVGDCRLIPFMYSIHFQTDEPAAGAPGICIKKGLKSFIEFPGLVLKSSAFLFEYSFRAFLRNFVASFLHFFIFLRFSSVGLAVYLFAYLFFIVIAFFPVTIHIRNMLSSHLHPLKGHMISRT